jgi:hypothetical protein
MLPSVRTVLDAEMIRDGGSLTVTFQDSGGIEWMLVLKIDVAHHEDAVETLGFKAPVLIEGGFHGAIQKPISWEEADALVRLLVVLAPAMSEVRTKWLNDLVRVVEARGGRLSDMPRFRKTLPPFREA